MTPEITLRKTHQKLKHDKKVQGYKQELSTLIAFLVKSALFVVAVVVGLDCTF